MKGEQEAGPLALPLIGSCYFFLQIQLLLLKK